MDEPIAEKNGAMVGVRALTLAMAASLALSGACRSRQSSDVPAGSSAAPVSPGDYQYSLEHGGLSRRYKVHVPKRYDGSRAVPLVVYVHGGGGDLRTAYQDGIDSYSEKFGFVLAVPEGTGEKKLGHVRASWNGGRWETGQCCGDADDVGFIAKMIGEVRSRLTIDGSRIYATGLSNGGLMTNRLACELSDTFAAIATVAPAAILSSCNPARPVSYLHIHGTEDPANPPDGSPPQGIFARGGSSGFSKDYQRMTPYQVVDRWKQINQCSDHLVPGYTEGAASCTTYDQCKQNARVELCIVQGMGHTYPSGHQYLPAKLVGPVSHDISFDQIWEFFATTPPR